MIQDVFAGYAWLGEVAVVIAFLGFLALIAQMFFERHSPRWKQAARLPLEEADEVTR